MLYMTNTGLYFKGWQRFVVALPAAIIRWLGDLSFILWKFVRTELNIEIGIAIMDYCLPIPVPHDFHLRSSSRGKLKSVC